VVCTDLNEPASDPYRPESSEDKQTATYLNRDILQSALSLQLVMSMLKFEQLALLLQLVMSMLKLKIVALEIHI
jgi:hypothetical protein